MKRYLILLFILNMTLIFSQTESDITNTDIIESIEAINNKLDRLLPENRIYETSMELGFTPGTIRFLPDVDLLNQYIAKSGEYGDFSGLLLPFINGVEVFSELRLSKTFSAGLNYYRYIDNNYGLHGLQNSEDTVSATYANSNDLSALRAYEDAVSAPVESDKLVDDNSDGVVDYYSYTSYLITGMELYIEHKIILTRDLSINIKPQLGYGVQEIEFSPYERPYWGSINPEQKVSWKQNLLILGAEVGLSYYLQGLEFILSAGLSYNHPLSDWLPIAGITDSDIEPGDIKPINIKISFGPVISLKL